MMKNLHTLISVAENEAKNLQVELKATRAKLEQQQQRKQALHELAQNEMTRAADPWLQADLYAWLRGWYQTQRRVVNREIADSQSQIDRLLNQIQDTLGRMKSYQRIRRNRLQAQALERLKIEAVEQDERNLRRHFMGN